MFNEVTYLFIFKHPDEQKKHVEKIGGLIEALFADDLVSTLAGKGWKLDRVVPILTKPQLRSRVPKMTGVA